MSQSQPKSAPSLAIDLTEFRQGWRILILSLLGIGTSVSVVPLYSFGSLILPLQEGLGWSREEIQPAISFLLVATIIAVQISGWLIRRHGLRPVAIISLIALSLSYWLITFITEVWQLYACYTLLAFAGMGTTMVTWTQLVNLWFDRNRGLALAIILCGTGSAALILPPLLNWAIELAGWKAGFWILALLPLLITTPLSIFWIRSDSPASAVVTRTVGGPLSLVGLSLGETARSLRFWLCNVALLLSVTAMVGMVTSTIPMLRDKGLSASDAAMAFSVYGVSLILGRVVVGYLVDRLWAPGVAFVVLAMPAVGCLMFSVVDTHLHSLMLASALVGLGAGAEMDIAAFLMARYFGMRDYSRIFSLHMGFIGLGAALAPLYFNYLFAQSGSYSGLLLHCTISFALGAALLLLMGRYPDFGRPLARKEHGEVEHDGMGSLSRSRGQEA